MVKKFILLAFLFSASVLAQEITAEAYTDTSDYLIGDRINFTVKVKYDKEIGILKPPVLDSLSNVDVFGEKPAETKEVNGRIETVYGFTLSRFDSADVVIPPIPVRYWFGKDTIQRAPFLQDKYTVGDTALKTIFTNEVRFTIHSMKVNVEEDIRDVKEPVKIPPDWRIIVLYIVLGLILIGLLIYGYFWYRNKRLGKPAEKKKIIIPPHVIALQSLDQLEKEQLWQKGMIKEYHTRITEIIRKYFEDRFSFPALELTTTEAMEFLYSKEEYSNITGITYSFLTNADLVKFAKYNPDGSINDEMLKQAREIIQNTIPSPEEKTGVTENV